MAQPVAIIRRIEYIHEKPWRNALEERYCMNRRKRLLPGFIPVLPAIALVASVFAASALLVSCIDIDSTIQFNTDGSGVLQLEYRVSRELTDLGGLEGDVPFPVTEEDFHFALEGTGGLELRKYRRKMDEENVTVSVEIAFDSLETLSALDSFQDMPMSLTKQDGELVFQQKIADARIQREQEGRPSAEDSPAVPDEELLAPLFEGYEMSFTVQAPGRITYHSLGELAKSKKSVTYAIPLAELNMQTDALILTVKWED
jgi:hypothetical protein